MPTDNPTEKRTAIATRMEQLCTTFLQRSAAELHTARGFFDRLSTGDAAGATDLRHLAHRIKGTGGSLGLGSVSDHAADLERWVEDPRTRDGEAAALRVLAELITRVEQEIGIELARRIK